MQRPIRPDWLLRQADELGGRTAGPGRPRTADLRRAVSNGYYALFHALTLAAAHHLLPNARPEARYALARAFRHDSLRDVFEWIRAGRATRHHAAELIKTASAHGPILDVADAFGSLREARHQADYDHAAELTRPATLVLIDLARDAVQKVNLLSGNPDFQAVLALAALRT